MMYLQFPGEIVVNIMKASLLHCSEPMNVVLLYVLLIVQKSLCKILEIER